MTKGIMSIKRGMAVLLSACMVFGVAPIQAGAEEAGTSVSGNETQTESSGTVSDAQTQAEPSESGSDAQTQAESSGSGSDNKTAEAAEADHYDENGFCKGYEIDPNGTGAWVKKSGTDACTDENCKGYQPATTVTDNGTEWVEIGNAGQLYWFADQVDNGKLISANIRLTADIVDNEGVTFGWDETNNYAVVAKDKNGQSVDVKTLRMWNPIGIITGGKKTVFQGHFNGQGHTVSGLYYCKGSDNCAGIFAKITKKATTIEQIGLENSYIYGKAATGGITGMTDDGCTFRQCYNAAYILSDVSVGGIVGGATVSEIYFFHDFNLGHLKNLGSDKFKNNIGQIIGKLLDFDDTKLINCYAVNDLGIHAMMNDSDKDSLVTFLSREDFYNGKAAYLLSLSEEFTWGQDLSDKNSLPNPCGAKVYKICGGYTNDASKVDTVKHSTVNGFCTKAGCDYQEEPVYNKEDNVYEISNAGQLYSYAEKAEKTYTAGAKLKADIVVNDIPLIKDDGTPITDTTQLRTWGGLFRSGKSELSFDGNDHSISGLYAKGTGWQGFALYNRGMIQNLQIKNSVCISTNSEAGGIVAGGRFGSGTYKIENCSFEGYVEGYEYAGGIAASCDDISNCYADAYVTGAGTVAPIVAEVDNYDTITNSAYNKDKYTGGSTQDGATGYTTSQFASGEVAYALNQGNGAAEDAKKAVWYQTLDGNSKDAAPSLKSTAEVVYQYTRLRCDGKPKTEDKVAYTNDSKKKGTSINDEHKYVIDTANHKHHKCSVCGETAAHTYTYEKVENTTDTIKATCSVCGDTYTVQLLAPTSEGGTLTYDGTAKAATTSITDGNLGETLTVTYATLTDCTESAYSEDAPKNAGSYRAKLALGSGDNAVSITVDYTIAKATPTITWPEDQKNQFVTYTGNAVDVTKITAPTVTLLSDDTFSDSSKITYSYRKVTDGKASGDFISGLPADIGTYEIKAAIPAEGNYTAAETADTMQLTIAYLVSAPDAVVTDKNNKTYHSDDWCPSDIVLKAPDGYKISMEVKGGYEASCTYTGSTENETITYYLRADKSGEIAEKTVTVKMDWTAPNFSSKQSGINIRMNWWNSLLSTITFGLYKGSLDVNIKADDSQSGVAEYYYYIDNSGSTTTLTAEELDTKTFTKVAADKNGTTKLTEIASDNNYVIYAYAVDAAGSRSTYISSDGVVLDNTAPNLTNVSVPAKSNGTLSDTSATITFTGSEAGTYYYILKENGKPAPTVMSDFAAKTAGDKVDTWTAKDGVSTGTLTADEANTIKLTGLKANTGYILYLAATDAAGNASVAESKGADGDSGVVSASFTTAKTIPYVKTAPVLSGNYGDTVSAMLEKADKTKASVTAGLSSDVTIKGTWSVASADADKIPTVGTSEKYTLTFTPTGNDADTYDPVTCEVTPEVSKKPVTIVIDDKLKTYGEANPELTWNLATGDVLVTGDTEAALRIRLSTTVQDNSNAGTYAITGSSDSANYAVTFTGSGSDGKSGVLTVKQAANEFTTELSCSDYTYAKGETPKPNATAKCGTVTYKYATADSDGKAPTADSAYTDAIPVNAGSYAVKAYVAETENYAELTSDPVVFTIHKAAKAPNMPQIAMTPAHSTNKVGDITLPEGWSWQEADRDTALADGVAVTATAVYTGADKGNYETESVIITITRSICDHTHTEIRNQQEATCKKEGYTGDTYCKDCGEKLATGTATVKKAHTVGTPATCVSKAVCSVCSETFGEVDATNHVHTTVKNRKEATCTQTGYTGDTYCTDCNKLLGMGKELVALGHDYKATVTKQPTTTEEGIRTYTCTRCNSSYTESIAKLPEEKHNHSYTGSITKEASCTEAGVRTYTCSCGDSYTESIPATGHSYVSKVTKAATTTEEGIMTYTCSKCGHSYTQPIAKIKSDDSSKDNGSQNQKPQTGTDNGNQNQKPQPDTDNGKDNGTSIKPYIKDDSGKEGWDVIKPQLEEAKSGDTVTVAMNGTTVVPKDVIDSIKGKNTTLVLDMGNGLSWKIFGKDITGAAGDIDFGVTVGADAGKSIPVDVINNVTGERYSINLTLAYDGEFGFTAILTINMESKNEGLYANLFYYNEQTGELEFVSAGQIDADGNVELVFTHASDYTIVVDTKIMSDNAQADNKADETIPAPKTDYITSKYAWNNTIIIIIGICIILIVFGAVFYVRKKSGSEEE